MTSTTSPIEPHKQPNKVLLVFCDGTGQDGSQASDTQSTTAASDATGVKHATNVWKMSRAVEPWSKDGSKAQIAFYQSGVGSEAGFNATKLTQGHRLRLRGIAVASKIRECYVFLAQNFQAGDEICIFGFSRGAYTARKLAGLIDTIGLLARKDLGCFPGIWQQLMDKKTPSVPPDTRRTDIRCVGVWDTVGSVFRQTDALNIVDTRLPATITCALHAVSMQENRGSFAPTLWDVPTHQELHPVVKGKTHKRVFKQIFFPGVHSDVGGGYESHELSDLALFWMAGEICDFVKLDLELIKESRLANTDSEPWGNAQPHNESRRLIKTNKTGHGVQHRLSSKHIQESSIFHQSVRFAPTKLNEPRNMITLESLKWTPKYADLNGFEKICKENW